MTALDATQACGWLPLQAPRVDAVVCAAHEWLMAPRGTVFIFVRDERLGAITPHSAGWYAGEDVHASYFGPPLRLARDARRLDTSPAWFSWVGTAPALELVNRIGVDAVYSHDVALANRFRAGLGLEDAGSTIVSVDLAGAAERLQRAGIVAALRAGRLRASWHVYNTDDDVKQALAALTGRPAGARDAASPPGPEGSWFRQEGAGRLSTPMTTVASSALGDGLHEARQRTLALVAPLDRADLEAVHDPLMSPLVWDLGHIAAYEDLWLVHRHGGQPLLREDLAALYDAFETPRAARGEIAYLRGQELYDYMAAVRERTLDVLERSGAGDGVLHEMVIRHEAQHNETMRQTLFLADLPGGAPAAPAPREEPEDWIEVPGGPCELGAGPDGFAFDNERPRHALELPAFGIARRPVTNATWRRFVEGGGYVRREWWSDEGWAWKEEYDITHPAGWTADGAPDDDRRPVMHVSWFEADAFARSRGARLPTEAEWERAATWAQEPLAGVGDVWEWTASTFGGYPGFIAYPYREYSEVFFGERYRVLRGASWGTDQRLRSTTFRNWDLPQRRQIFAGVRLATDSS